MSALSYIVNPPQVFPPDGRMVWGGRNAARDWRSVKGTMESQRAILALLRLDPCLALLCAQIARGAGIDNNSYVRRLLDDLVFRGEVGVIQKGRYLHFYVKPK